MFKTFAAVVFFVLTTTVSVWAVSFELGESYSTGPVPHWTCQADFNGDGHTDLAVTHWDDDPWPDPFNNSGISILFGNGDGTFSDGGEYVTGYCPCVICPGDFDNDGDIDLASTKSDNVLESDPDSLYVLTNDGNGVFELSTTIVTTVQFCRGMCATDLDGDGPVDLVLVGTGNGSFCTMINDGSGGFALGTTYAAGDSPVRVCASDFDLDGDEDLAATNSASDESLSIFTNDGSGIFARDSVYSYWNDLTSLHSVDLNKDGYEDLVAVSQAVNMVEIRLNNGDATFADAIYYPVPGPSFSSALADFDGDGNEDLAVTCHWYDSVSILCGAGDGTFAIDSKYSVGAAPIFLAASDFDEDGDVDLAVTNNASDNITIMLNTTVVTAIIEDNQSAGTPASFGLRQNYPNPFNPSTSIEFYLPQLSQVEMTIYNIAGQAVRHLVKEELPAGTHTIEWNGVNDNNMPVATGIYLCHLRAGDIISMRKMALLK